ncbi:DUF4097 family beta strand repeat protein [Streptomyces sp. ISL-22]|uniref:DUF4097 family beta strand repeat-containing protein n=1 Tax=unclassified Streptomyces TaxID=2593676 RepID=UPI001BEA86A5|nr:MULTISPECIES: DUF4097 family beta strand repeat-containing protein [unclassified Streptomyces]MBT2417461.1 DUF4097 family beta strand repeat protein [Streptomyces sp. ISL-24]MBT2437195.1 DUF4097 family beta strand repeat protein [Streptomyces sp. ISL-22]
MSEWSVAEPTKLTFEEPVSELHVRIVNGTVNVVGTDEGSARLEVSELEGPPLSVTQQGGTLTVAYEDLPWKGFLKWLDRKGWRRSAVVSLAVPAHTRVEVGVVGAGAVVSGIHGPSVVKGVTGDTTLVGLSGPVRADTVSGNLEAQAVTGDLRFNSVSGDLTVLEGSGPSVKADSVSGSMIVDLDPDGPTDIRLTSVSGEIAIRLPAPADADVEANTASGTISNAFEGLRVHGQWGAHKVTGRLGAGTGRLRATTVSGSIALLRRPLNADEPWEAEAWEEPAPTTDTPNTTDTPDTADTADTADSPDPDTAAETGARNGTPETPPTDSTTDPVNSAQDDSGDNSVSGQGDGPSDAPADGTTDKKVL